MSAGMVHVSCIDGLVQERRNSSALAIELRLSCINPLICWKSSTGQVQYDNLFLGMGFMICISKHIIFWIIVTSFEKHPVPSLLCRVCFHAILIKK